MSVDYDCSVLWQAGMETAIVLLGRHLENAINLPSPVVVLSLLVYLKKTLCETQYK